MTPTDSTPSTAPQDSYADWDENASGRRPGDDPFLPEEGLFWWLPKASLLLLVLLGIGYLVVATVQHGKYQLVRSSDGNAGLERGRFALSGWAPFVPDGALDAWSPIAWPKESIPSPLRGDLVDLSDTYLGFLRSAASAHIEDDGQLDRLSAHEERFESWYRDRWGADSVPQLGNVKGQRAARDLARREVVAATEAAAQEQRKADLAAKHQAEVEEQARLEQERSSLDRARSYAVRRRLLLKEAEALLEGLPEGGGPEATRDRDAVERLIDSMNTPVGFP